MKLRKNSRLARRVAFSLWTWRLFGPAFKTMLTARPRRTFPVHIAWMGQYGYAEYRLGMVKDDKSPNVVALRHGSRTPSGSLPFCWTTEQEISDQQVGIKRPTWYRVDTEIITAPVDTGHPGLCPVCVEVYLEALLMKPETLKGRAA